MKVFLSWSGKKSQLVATELQDWLSCIFQSTEFWISKNNISLGSRWNNAISEALENTDFGIICITRENIKSPWIMFEAGAISKSIENGRVIPFLIDAEMTDLQGGPLSFFQAINTSKKDIFKMVQALANSSSTNFRDSKTLESVFEKWYPDLEKRITEINQSKSYPIDKSKIKVLTTMQLSILKLLSEGKNRNEISQELSKTRMSIDTHLINLFRKLEVKSKDELIEIVKHNGLI